MTKLYNSSNIQEEDFDFRKKANSDFKEEVLIYDYIAIFCALLFAVFLYQHIHIDTSLNIDNLFNIHGLIFKHNFS